MDPVVSIVLEQRKAVTALKLIAPLVEAEEYEPDAASEATGMSSGGSTEVCPAFELIEPAEVWAAVDCVPCAVAAVGSSGMLE